MSKRLIALILALLLLLSCACASSSRVRDTDEDRQTYSGKKEKKDPEKEKKDPEREAEPAEENEFEGLFDLFSNEKPKEKPKSEAAAAVPEESEEAYAETVETRPPEEPAKKVKVGFICLHDEQSTYDLNFINAARAACAELGVTDFIIKMNIAEGIECFDAASDLVESGCNIIFANSYGHQDLMVAAAVYYPDVEFCHCSGVTAHTERLPNFHNAYAAIHEGRYLTGVAAGLQLNEMIAAGKITADQARIGFVGTFTYAEVISAYTAFFLGARSVCPEATMEVTFAGSWYDEMAEYECAQKLIGGGCVLISQYSESPGAPRACEEAGVLNVSYTVNNSYTCPNTYLIGSRIDWTPYYEYAINAVMQGDQIATDWTGDLSTGSVVLLDPNPNVMSVSMMQSLATVEDGLRDGRIHVFDTATFTKDGAPLTDYMADVDNDPAFLPDTQVVSDGYFHESEYRSAPYFDIMIDGITLLDTMY